LILKISLRPKRYLRSSIRKLFIKLLDSFLPGDGMIREKVNLIVLRKLSQISSIFQMFLRIVIMVIII
jgi:hypothetical protein